MTDKVLQFKNIDAWLKLSESQNSKVIITNGNTPMLINPDMNTSTPKVSSRNDANNAAQSSLVKD
ncbi:MAG: hypothetical protein HC778_08835 [Chamaesiphon sp. CSU_1_12]|nr:hypothetical protein [Chamaesiphon sp. CSU_1_12]